MWPSRGPLPDSKCSTTVEVQCYCQELNLVSSRSPLRKSKKKKNIDLESAAAQQQYKSACVCALTGSASRKMAEGLQRVAAPSGNRLGTHITRLTATRLNTEPWFRIDLSKKMVYDSLHLATLFWACRIVVLGLLKLSIRHDIPEFLTSTLLLVHAFVFNKDWSWNIFTSHNICLLFIVQLIDLRKLRIWKSAQIFKIELWTVGQERSRLLLAKADCSNNLKIENRSFASQIESMQVTVTIWLSNIAFHLRPIWLQTLIAIESKSYKTSFPSFCAPLSDLDLLLYTGFDLQDACLFLCLLTTQRPMNYRNIEQSDERSFGW